MTNIQHPITLMVGFAIKVIQASPLLGDLWERESSGLCPPCIEDALLDASYHKCSP